MIDIYIDVPYDTADEDKFNDAIGCFKGQIIDKYCGKEVHIIVKAVKKPKGL